MQCTSCGAQLPDNATTCPNCGNFANNFNQQNFNPSSGYQQPLSKKQFLKHANLKKCRTNINSSAIILYICAGITLAISILGGVYSSIIDILILVGLGLGIQLAQSRVCAIIACVYAAFNVLYMLVSTGAPGGYLILIAAIYAIIATFGFQKSWKEYQQTGILPPAR